jgi:hypothetical protein
MTKYIIYTISSDNPTDKTIIREAARYVEERVSYGQTRVVFYDEKGNQVGFSIRGDRVFVKKEG